MTAYGDIDAMNERALESLDRLAEIGTYDHTERLRMSEPVDEDETTFIKIAQDETTLIRASYDAVLGQPSVLDDQLYSVRVADQHDLQTRLK